MKKEDEERDLETRRISLWSPAEELIGTGGNCPLGTLRVYALGEEVVFSSERESEDLEEEVRYAVKWAEQQQKHWAEQAARAQRKLCVAEHFVRMVKQVGKVIGLTPEEMRGGDYT